jgi:hypothetical protein
MRPRRTPSRYPADRKRLGLHKDIDDTRELERELQAVGYAQASLECGVGDWVEVSEFRPEPRRA